MTLQTPEEVIRQSFEQLTKSEAIQFKARLISRIMWKTNIDEETATQVFNTVFAQFFAPFDSHQARNFVIAHFEQTADIEDLWSSRPTLLTLLVSQGCSESAAIRAFDSAYYDMLEAYELMLEAQESRNF